MFENLRRSFLIQHPKLDGSDVGRFMGEIGKACEDNVHEARAVERLIAEALRPIRRAAWEKGKQLLQSRHRRNWHPRNFFK